MSLNVEGLSFHHIGYATDDIQRDLKAYLSLGFVQEGDFFEDPIQKIRGVFLTMNGYRLELVTPLVEASPLDSFIRRNIKMYHHGFKSSEFESAMDKVRSLPAVMLGKPAPSVAFGGKRIVFFMMKNKDIVEIIED